MKLEELIERMEEVSFDEITPKSKFLEVLNNFPEFKQTLEKELSLDENKEWVEKAEKEKLYFIINDSSWKKTRSPFPDNIRLNFVGINSIPTVSINIY